MDWAEFTAAFATFAVSHVLPLRPQIRTRLTGVLGEWGFGLIYSAVSVGVLVWLIAATGRAPHVDIWLQLPWHKWVPVVATLVACVILVAGTGRPNPFSFGGARNDQFDPERPGLVRWVRHPILAAPALWAAAHLLPNGDLAHVILFGVLCGFAVSGMRMIDRRKQRSMDKGQWDAMRTASRAKPADWRDALPVPRLIAAGALFVVMNVLHPLMIGVPVFIW